VSHFTFTMALVLPENVVCIIQRIGSNSKPPPRGEAGESANRERLEELDTKKSSDRTYKCRCQRIVAEGLAVQLGGSLAGNESSELRSTRLLAL
jgi:hypothetical protein